MIPGWERDQPRITNYPVVFKQQLKYTSAHVLLYNFASKVFGIFSVQNLKENGLYIRLVYKMLGLSMFF